METNNQNTDIKALLDSRNQSGLKSLLESWLPDELAILCQDLTPDDMLAVFMAIDRERAFQTFGSCSHKKNGRWLYHCWAIPRIPLDA